MSNHPHPFFLFFKKLFTSKSKYFTIGAIVIFMLSFVVAFIPYYNVALEISPERQVFIGVCVDILVGIGTSLLATSLISTIQILDFSELRTFKRLFSLNHHRKVAIVIPNFDKIRLYKKITDRLPDEILNDIDKLSLERKIDEHEGLFIDEASYVGFADFEAISYIVALFQKFHYKLPEVITDDLAVAILNDPQKYSKQYGTILSIGTYSNKLSWHIIKKEKIGVHNLPSYFDLKEDQLDPKHRVVVLKEVVEANKIEDRDYSPGETCSDLAIFSKVSFGDAEKRVGVIILGGLNATGTTALGKFIFEKWSTDICQTRSKHISDNEYRDVLDQDNFAIIYEVIGEGRNIHYDTTGRINTKPKGVRI